MKKALIFQNQIHDIVAVGSEFPVSPEMQWVDAPDDVSSQTHQVVAGVIALKPPKPLAEIKASKLAQLDTARDAAERANVTVGGKVYSASESFQAKVSRAINQSGRGRPIAGAADAWRTADMQPVVMTAALLNQIEDTITAQSATAWARFGLRFDALDAAFKANDRVALDAVVW